MNMCPLRIRTLAATCTLTALALLGAGRAAAAGAGGQPPRDPDPLSAQHQLDLADGKLSAEHLQHKAAKDAEEQRLGIAPPNDKGGIVPTITVIKDGKKYYAPASMGESAAIAAANSVLGNNLCAAGQICLYYNSGLKNANYPKNGPDARHYNYAGHTFNNGQGMPGYGQKVKNNTASIMNGYMGQHAFVLFVNSGYKGDREWYVQNDGYNLNETLKNDNASGACGGLGEAC
ncbi:hypothetical protein ACFXDJ_15455 [Streptomyces sp. NPDC059443]|uniref:hypothetical protein n=1 Tax=unclassified Streptomyces TaxID=2593676 RepID=UPI0036CDFE6A